MTFRVVTVGSEPVRVIGTIWAEGESQARLMASDVCAPRCSEPIEVRPADEVREIPLRLPN